PGWAARACWSTSCACGGAAGVGSSSASPRCCPPPRHRAWDTWLAIWPARRRCRAGPRPDRAGHRASAAPAGSRHRPCGDIVEGVAQEVDVATLPDGLRQDLADRLLQPRMIVGDDELDPEQAAALQVQQEALPARSAL